MVEMDSIDIRIADYLDDKLQTSEDFADLDSLLAAVEHQRNQLQSQLDSTITDLDRARAAQIAAAADLDSQIEAFQYLQASIDTRVAATTTFAAPTVAIQRLQEPLRKIQTVETAAAYLETLQDVHALKEQALTLIANDPRAAVRPARELEGLAGRLRELHIAADEAAVHLVGYVEQQAVETWMEMRGVLAKQLEGILKERKWPQVDVSLEMDDEWLLCINKVLDFQMQGICALGQPGPAVPLLPFEVMADVFIAEFKYNFMSDRKTSAPELTATLCFKWFLDTVERWEEFFRDNLRTLLALKVKDTAAAENLAYVDPVCALLTTMLPVMLEKARLTLQEKADDVAFLSSFMASLMDFDDQVRLRFSYDDGNIDGWLGLTTAVLEDWFPRWFTAEKEFALKRLQTILDAPDARTIDYDYGGDGKTKPTKGAVRVTDLLRGITGQYRQVRKFSYRLKFLVYVQMDVLDTYHDYLKGGLQAYQTITSTVGRTLHGVSKADQLALEGTGGMESLCKVYGSAEHVIGNLRDWSNEEFFVTLWDELHGRAKGGDHKRVTSTVTIEQVKDRISGAVQSESKEAALFDETIASFNGVRSQAKDLLVGAVASSHNKALRSYLNNLQWTRLIRDHDADVATGTSDELVEFLGILSRNLDFLRKILGSAPLRRVVRSAIDKLQITLWNNVLMHSKFTVYGAAQFSRDVTAITAIIDQRIPSASSALGSLTDGVQLLNLPVESSDGPTFRGITDRVFLDNLEAKIVLEELQLEDLSHNNARDILRQRVEFED